MGGDLLQQITLISMAVASCTIGLVGLAVYASNKKSVTNQAFLLFSISAITWSVFNYLTFQGASEALALWFLRFQVFSAVLYSFSLFRFFYVFPDPKSNFSKAYKYFVIPLTSLAGFITLTPLVFVRIAEFSNGRVETVINGPGLPLFGMTAIFLIVSGVTILIRKMRRSIGSRKLKLIYVLIGTSITFTLHIVFNFVLPALFNNTVLAPLGAVFIAPFVIFTTYTIVKHQFLNVKVILAELATAALVITKLVQLFNIHTLGDLILQTIVLLFIAIFGYLLVRSVQAEVKRREEG